MVIWRSDVFVVQEGMQFDLPTEGKVWAPAGHSVWFPTERKDY
jgi:hypothetical protein